MDKNKRISKIKIVTNENFPFGGAPANFVRNFARAIALENTDVEVILPTGNIYGKNVEYKSARSGEINGIKYKHLGFTDHPRNLIGKFFDLFLGQLLPPFYLFILNFKENYNTIIVYNTHITRILNLILFSKIFKKKLIIILPEFYQKPQKGLIALYHWYDFFLGLRYFSKFAHGFIPLTQFMKEFIIKELKIVKLTKILPNVIDPESFEIKNVEPFKHDKITIGYAGTPTAKDGVVDLIKSFALLTKIFSNVHLLVIGDVINGESILPTLRMIATETGCLKNITFTGLVPQNKIPELLNSCQILTLTRPSGTFAEAGFPTKLGEYFACKKPVVLTVVGDIPRYFINEEHVVLVEPEQPENIAAGFEKIILNHDLADKIAQNGYLWMKQNLDFRKIAIDLNTFINSIQ